MSENRCRAIRRNSAASVAFASVLCMGTASAEEVNNGTDPAVLARTLEFSYKHLDLKNANSTGLVEARYTLPFAGNKMGFTFKAPFASGPVDTSFGLGDVGLVFTHVPYSSTSGAFAYEVEISFNSADRPDLGRGQTVAQFSSYFLNYTEVGIIAPALVHEIGLGDEDAGRTKVNVTTFDLYYVPKIANPRRFLTFDPAIIHDWEADQTYASLSVTYGVVVGKALGGNAVVYFEPQVFAGGDRPADWGFQIGYKVIGF